MIFDNYIVTKEEAKEIGLNYQATLYGVPIYTNDDYDSPALTTKFTPMQYWIDLCEFFVSICLIFSSNDNFYELPIKNVRKI